MSIQSNLKVSLQTLAATHGSHEADAAVKALEDFVAYQIEKTPLELLSITSDNKVEGPLAPAILKIVNDAITDYHAQVVARNRVMTAEEKVNSDKVRERLMSLLDEAPPKVLNWPADTDYENFDGDPGRCGQFDHVVAALKKGKPTPPVPVSGFDSVIDAQREAAAQEFAALPKCQHDLTKPIATRHVIDHTDDRIVTKCLACGEFRTYELKEVKYAR